MLSKLIDAYRTAYSDLPAQIWMLSGALFINRLGTMVLPFLTLYLTKSEGYTNAQAGFVISIYGFGSVVGAYLGGRLTGHVGAIGLQVVLLLLSVPVYLALPFCTSFVQLAIAVFALSVFSEGVRPANATAVTQFSTPEQRTQAFALNRMALNLGFSFGPAIGGLLVSISFFWIFVADAITTAACALILLRFFGFRRPVKKSEIVDRDHSNLGSPIHDRVFWIYLLLTFTGAVVFFQFFTTYPLYLNHHYGLNEFQIGCIFAVNTAIIVLFEMVFVSLAKNWNLILSVGWGTFFACLGFGILPLSTGTWFCVLAMIILTIGEMLAAPMSSSWVSQRSENRDTGSYMGWYTMSYSLAFIVGPAIGGVVYEYDSSLLFYSCAAIGLMVLIGYGLLNRSVVTSAATPNTSQSDVEQNAVKQNAVKQNAVK